MEPPDMYLKKLTFLIAILTTQTSADLSQDVLEQINENPDAPFIIEAGLTTSWNKYDSDGSLFDTGQITCTWLITVGDPSLLPFGNAYFRPTAITTSYESNDFEEFNFSVTTGNEFNQIGFSSKFFIESRVRNEEFFIFSTIGIGSPPAANGFINLDGLQYFSTFDSQTTAFVSVTFIPSPSILACLIASSLTRRRRSWTRF